MKHILRLTLLLPAAALLAISSIPALAAPKDNPMPDFTKGDKPTEKTHDWTLGPTGARG